MKKTKKIKGHWTNNGVENFQARITLDFVTQLEDRIEILPDMTKSKLAEKLGVTPGAVSQKLNSPDNLELKTITTYSRALGAKVAIVLYDDGDHDNNNGPVNSEIFAACWEKQGKPTDFRTLNPTVAEMPKANIIEWPLTTNARWAVSKNSKATYDPPKKVAA